MNRIRPGQLGGGLGYQLHTFIRPWDPAGWDEVLTLFRRRDIEIKLLLDPSDIIVAYKWRIRE